MNLLLDEAKIPCDIVFEMEEGNGDSSSVDVALVTDANDAVNPAALEDPGYPISGMPVRGLEQQDCRCAQAQHGHRLCRGREPPFLQGQHAHAVW